jgi:hypothetical protein
MSRLFPRRCFCPSRASSRVPITREMYAGVTSEVLDVLRVRARVSGNVKKLCLC